MCSHYQTLKDAELLLKKFGASKPAPIGKYDMWPRYQGVFVRRPVNMTRATRRYRSAKLSPAAGVSSAP
ncbi:hypothetical protein D3C78_1875300 [compost metagenome]